MYMRVKLTLQNKLQILIQNIQFVLIAWEEKTKFSLNKVTKSNSLNSIQNYAYFTMLLDHIDLFF